MEPTILLLNKGKRIWGSEIDEGKRQRNTDIWDSGFSDYQRTVIGAAVGGKPGTAPSSEARLR